jgi:AcrR family transcriptional regulator
MRNPEATKEKILKSSGALFNTQGYKATSISDITDATGYTKGAIYRHFTNKDALEMETLWHLSSQMFSKLRERIVSQPTAGLKLRAVFSFFESYVTSPPIKGGCPLLNAAIEADDANPALRKAAQKVLNVLRDSLVRVLENGIKHGQVKPDVDSTEFASWIIGGLEGAIMMSKLTGNNDDIRRMMKLLEKELKEIEL